jgi:WD40 repeat protein
MGSASLDSRILLWDVHTATAHRELKGHVKGVLSLSYIPENRLLFSASFDRDVLVWNPTVDSAVFRLKGTMTRVTVS